MRRISNVGTGNSAKANITSSSPKFPHLEEELLDWIVLLVTSLCSSFPHLTDLMKLSVDPWKAEWEMDRVRMNCGGSFQFLLFLLSFKSCPTLWPHGLQHTRIPCPSVSPRVCQNSYPLSRWCHPTISSFLTPLSSCPQSFPASRSFPVSRLFAFRLPKYESFQWVLRVDFL